MKGILHDDFPGTVASLVEWRDSEVFKIDEIDVDSCPDFLSVIFTGLGTS